MTTAVILLPGLDQWPWAVTTSPTPATSRPTTRPQAAAPRTYPRASRGRHTVCRVRPGGSERGTKQKPAWMGQAGTRKGYPMQTSEVLNRAADLIEGRGWSKGTEGWQRTSSDAPLCVEGGIMAALGLDVNTMTSLWKCPAYHAVADYVDSHDPISSTAAMGSRDLWRWNDTQAKAARVVEVLRACAVIEASRERESAEVV